MGAGLSGLACAITLEQNGIEPVIFEKRASVGDRFINCEILLSTLSRPIDDAVQYFSENHHIYLRPQSNIQKLIIHSPNHKAVISGKLGYTNLRGRVKNGFEKQLAEQSKSKIRFNSKKSYEELLHEYTHVILATGDAAYANKITDFNVELTVKLKGGNITGEFDIDTIHAWLNNNLAPHGYSYLIPISHEKANIVIAYPEYPENKAIDSETLWENFKNEVSHTLNQSQKIHEHFEISRYIIGLCKYPRIGNTFLVGNNFGAVMPFLGFGQLVSILTGIYAGLDLSGQGDYLKLTKPLRESFNESLSLRRTLEKMSNNNMDTFVKSLQSTLGQKLFKSRHNYLKILSDLVRPFI